MSDAALRASLIRLAHANPDLRHRIIPLVTDRVAMEFSSQEALDKYLKDHPKADKSKHKVKGEGGGDKGKSDKGKSNKGKGESRYSEKHKVHLRGITDEALDAFYDSPAGKEIKGYNLEVIAGSDGVVDADSIERAVKVREKHLAIQRAKKKKENDPDSLTDEDKANLKTDVCKATPACEGNLGVARSSMPQFLQVSPKAAIAGIPDNRYQELLAGEKAGKGLPSDISQDESEAYYNRKNAEAAIEAGADPNSDVSVFDDWVKGLKKDGIKVTRPKNGMRVGDLKATQREISADAVLKNADKYLRGEDLTGGVIYVSSDGHILDGHHRWAGLLTADPDAMIPVVKVGVPMSELLEKSFNHPGVFRQDFRFQTVSPDEPLDLARKPGATWQQRNGKWYGKNKDGESGGPFATQDSAKAFATGATGKSAGVRWPDYRGRSASVRGAASMNLPFHTIHDLIRFADSYVKLGWSVQEQLRDLLDIGNGADLNENAIKMVLHELHPLPREIKEACESYLEYVKGEGGDEDMSDGRYASSNDTTLRNRLIRLAHARPDLRGHILPLVSDKAACGWDGGESDTKGCGEGTVMAKHEKGKSVDPTKDMSPEDAAEWKKQNAINRDQFTKGAGRRTAGTVIDHNSIRSTTNDPQVYDTWLLTDRARNGKKPQMAARQVMSQFKSQLSQMRAGDAVTFVDDKVMAMTGKYPDWHYYSMPD